MFFISKIKYLIMLKGWNIMGMKTILNICQVTQKLEYSRVKWFQQN